MRFTPSRLLITLLTFAIGAALVATYARLRSTHCIETVVTVPSTQPTIEPAPQPPGPLFPPLETIVEKIADLPQPPNIVAHDHFEIQFLDDYTGWLIDETAIWRTSDGGAHWRLIYSDVSGQSTRWAPSMGTIKFINSFDGWRLHDRELYRTINGGASWQRLPTPRYPQILKDIEFLPDGKHGWLAGSRCKYVSNAEAPNRFVNACAGWFPSVMVPSVYATADGGKTWKAQRISAELGDISSIRMRDLNHGFATGQAGTFRYEHGSWIDARKVRLDLEQNDNQFGAEDGCLSIVIGAPTFAPTLFQIVDNRRGWLMTSNGYISRTDDGGRTWVDIARISSRCEGAWPKFINGLYISTSGQSFALDSGGALRSTKDGGVSWEQLTATEVFTSMFALDEKCIWLLSVDGVYRLRLPIH
jgi:photosystem II stability/assembly factor-like uncharacterized protein